MSKGSFTVSLDFELFWGIYGHKDLSEYKDNISGGIEAISMLLALFKKYNIHATWATVGFLMAEGFSEASEYVPNSLPAYKNDGINTYRLLQQNDKNLSQFLFAPSKLREISATEGQEIATHTFSHYYCREEGQTIEQFEEDIKTALKIASDKGYKLETAVFPKNLYTKEYVEVLKKLGFKAFRGLENKWLYEKENSFLYKVLRLLDTYFPITEKTCYLPEDDNGIIKLSGSMMYRPYFKPLFFLERLKLYRIKRQMKYAAVNNCNFHLWWHPHNIGVKTDFHLKQLEEIFMYYNKLATKYGMESLNMSELVQQSHEKVKCSG